MGRTNPPRVKAGRFFFLNIGAAPSNPMLPHEIVMTLREFFVLQNTIHWIKSIAIDTNIGAATLTSILSALRPVAIPTRTRSAG